ncbi:MAG: polyketide cyclase [Marmoricola sp.]|nr:polyketide cyclase [Marmoricola sp.]
MTSRHLGVVVRRDPVDVYDYAVDPAHLPAWAHGLTDSDVRVEGDALVVDSPMGRVEIAFVARNDLGVLDHDVTLPDGTVVTNPLRVLAHPDGAEVVFTVRQLDLTDEAFERDAATVLADLERLRDLLEG